MKHDWNFGFFPYGDNWRIHRRLFVSGFGAGSEHLYNRVQEAMAGQLLVRLLSTPEDFLDHLRLSDTSLSAILSSTFTLIVYRHAGQLILKYTYGVDVRSRHDRYVQVAQNVMDAVSDAGKPGAWVVDALPFREFIVLH